MQVALTNNMSSLRFTDFLFFEEYRTCLVVREDLSLFEIKLIFTAKGELQIEKNTDSNANEYSLSQYFKESTVNHMPVIVRPDKDKVIILNDDGGIIFDYQGDFSIVDNVTSFSYDSN